MKSNLVVVLLLIACVALGGVFYGYWRKSNSELAELRQENEALVEQNLKIQESVTAQDQAGAEELARLKQENTELLRLRNEVRQLREERKALGVQVQSAQQQAQQLQEQAHATEQRLAAQVQAAAQAAQSVQVGAVPPGLSAAEAEMFRRRYGIAPQTNPQEACLNILRQLDGATQQWALENRKPGISVPTAQDLTPYLRGETLPTCPQGGIYTLHAANASPTCTVPGHALPR